MIEIVSINDGGRWLPKMKSVVSGSGWCDLASRRFSRGEPFAFRFLLDNQSIPRMERPVLARLGNLAQAGSSEGNRLHGILGKVPS